MWKNEITIQDQGPLHFTETFASVILFMSASNLDYVQDELRHFGAP